MRRLNVVVVGVLVIAAIGLLPMWRPVDARTGAPDGLLTDAPAALTGAMRVAVRPGDHVFNPQPWGSWFEFTIPDARYAIDSRIEFFPPEVWDQYEGVVAGVDGWQDLLDTWGVTWVVVAADQAAFGGRLMSAGWSSVYQDAEGALFARQPATSHRGGNGERS